MSSAFITTRRETPTVSVHARGLCLGWPTNLKEPLRGRRSAGTNLVVFVDSGNMAATNLKRFDDGDVELVFYGEIYPGTPSNSCLRVAGV